MLSAIPDVWHVRRKQLPGAAVALLVLFFSTASRAQTLAAADPVRYLDDVRALTAQNMEGRGAGTKGIERAASLLEKTYKHLGLQPAGTNSYRQPFSVITGAKLKSHNRLAVDNAGQPMSELKLNQDFVPFSFSSSGSASAPLVFAGFGATAEEFGYDDYAGMDVKDKIVVLLRYEPGGFASKNGNAGLTRHAQLITKAINARNHGAKAIILINGRLGDGEEDLLTRFGSVSGPENTGIILVQVKNQVANEWFKAAGKSLADVQLGIDHANKPQSFPFPEQLHVSIKTVESYRARLKEKMNLRSGTELVRYAVRWAETDEAT